MQITSDGHLIYEDPHPKISQCLLFPSEGTDVCSDVIRIPLNGPSVGTLNISTHDYLMLCEVQVFGGIEYIFFHLTYLYLIPLLWYDISLMFMVRQLLSKLLLSKIRFEKHSMILKSNIF